MNEVTGDIFKHEATNHFYQIIGFGIIEATETHAVIYKDINSSIVWIRPSSEFFDGRFTFFGRYADD
jgi:hypothetical protein